MKKIQSREAILKKSSFQYGMKISIENEIFIPGPSPAAEKLGLGLKFSIENEKFKPRMKISSENENFVRGGMIFSCVRARMNFFDPRALWGLGSEMAFQPEFGAYWGLARVLKSPSNSQNCRKKQNYLNKGTFIFCAKPWYAPNPGSKEI